jgi:hypothetical protein
MIYLKKEYNNDNKWVYRRIKKNKHWTHWRTTKTTK